MADKKWSNCIKSRKRLKELSVCHFFVVREITEIDERLKISLLFPRTSSHYWLSSYKPSKWRVVYELIIPESERANDSCIKLEYFCSMDCCNTWHLPWYRSNWSIGELKFQIESTLWAKYSHKWEIRRYLHRGHLRS